MENPIRRKDVMALANYIDLPAILLNQEDSSLADDKCTATHEIGGREYLDENAIPVYMRDAMLQFIQQNVNQNKMNAAKFLKDYFVCVHQGTHIIGREFEFVSATKYNRACLVRVIWASFKQLHLKKDLFQLLEYHAMVSLLCVHFPQQLIKKCSRLVFDNDDLSNTMYFLQFMSIFQIVFYFEDFLSEAESVYDQIRATETVAPSIGVDSDLFSVQLLEIMEKKYSCPKASVIEEILEENTFITMIEFVLRLSSHKEINGIIGQLPKSNDS